MPSPIPQFPLRILGVTSFLIALVGLFVAVDLRTRAHVTGPGAANSRTGVSVAQLRAMNDGVDLKSTSKLVVFSPSLSPGTAVASRQMTRPGSQNPQKKLPSVPSPIESEAANQVNKAWDEYLTKCGESYFLKGKKMPYSDHVGWIFEYRSVSIKTQQFPLDEADRLNGIQWKGKTTFTAGTRRVYDLRKWSKWESVAEEFALALTKTQGSWTVATQIDSLAEYTKLTCSEIPGLETSQGRPDLPNDSRGAQSTVGSVGVDVLRNANVWKTLTPQGAYGIRYEQHEKLAWIVVNKETLMSCSLDPQYPDDNRIIISPPSPIKKYVLVMCWDRGGEEAYVIETQNNRVASRDVVPKHWRIIKWVSFSPDERYALVAAAGEITMGDMAFVDLTSGRLQEINFKNFTNNRGIDPRKARYDRIQDFDPDKVSWISATNFHLTMDVRCNPYEGDEGCYDKVISSHSVRVNLNPFGISYVSVR